MIKNTMLAVGLLCSTALPMMAQELPTEGELQSRVVDELPSYWGLQQFRVIASDVRGDPLDPMGLVRFEADIIPTSDLYSSSGERIGPFEVIINSYNSQEPRTLYGTMQLNYRGGEWIGNANIENPVDMLGVPRDAYSQPTVILGSDEQDILVRNFTEASVANLAAAHALKMESLRAQHENEVMELEGTLKASLASMKNNYEPSIESEKQRQASELENLEQQHVQVINQLKIDHARKIGDIKAKQAAQISELETAFSEKKAQLERDLVEAKEIIKIQDELIPTIKASSSKQAELQKLISENKRRNAEFFSSFGMQLHGSLNCKYAEKDRVLNTPIFFEVSDATATGLSGKVKFSQDSRDDVAASLNLSTAASAEETMLTFAIEDFGVHELRLEDNGIMRGVGSGDIKSSMSPTSYRGRATCITVLGGK